MMDGGDQGKCQVMTADTSNTDSAAFGTFKPPPSLAKIIAWARWTSASRVFYLFSSLMRKLALRDIGAGSVDFEYRGMNVRFRPNGNTAEKRALLNPYRFDREELAFIEANLPAGGIFLDIGANVGLYSLVAAKVAGPGGRVLAFEPNPPVMERLAFNIASNPPDETGLAVIDMIGKAVTDRNGQVTFFPPQKNLGEGRVVTADEEQSDSEGSFSVEGVRLEDCLAKRGITRTDMMKVDIEGHEIHALEPFLTEASGSLHPDYMIVERGDEAHWAPLADLFNKAGYEPCRSCHMNEIWQKMK